VESVVERGKKEIFIQNMYFFRNIKECFYFDKYVWLFRMKSSIIHNYVRICNFWYIKSNNKKERGEKDE